MEKYFIRRFIALISIIFFLILCSYFTFNKLYIREKCKNLYFATEYLATKGNIKNSFLTIKNFELSFLDNNIAHVKINGLSYEKPHKSLSALAYFKKEENSPWELEKIERLT